MMVLCAGAFGIASCLDWSAFCADVPLLALILVGVSRCFGLFGAPILAVSALSLPFLSTSFQSSNTISLSFVDV
jgi:hypothetical protein